MIDLLLYKVGSLIRKDIFNDDIKLSDPTLLGKPSKRASSSLFGSLFVLRSHFWHFFVHFYCQMNGYFPQGKKGRKSVDNFCTFFGYP